jgi:lipopolysaccharide/colanic/teichoic acid biosynthesis glycosyltransferase
MARRAFDVVVAAAALAATSPILAVAIIAIRLESPGHPIYRQRRIGMDGRPFDVLKLRTMVAGAESMGSGLAVNEGDPRITRVGAVLRRFSIDELPNLVNVLRGDMAIIGPRPTVPVQVVWRSAPASRAGRRSTGARRCRGASGSSSTSGTSSTAACAWTSGSSCARPRSSSAATGSTRASPAAGTGAPDGRSALR